MKKVAALLFDPLEQNPAIEELMIGYNADLESASGNQASYEILPKTVVKEFPPLVGGKRYTKEDYLAALKDPKKAYQKSPGLFLYADYEAILRDYKLKDRLRKREAGEIWLWGGGYFGFWESILGGWGAFPCNSPDTIKHTCLMRRFAVMGFNPERGVGEMLESFGHRVEATLARKFRSENFLASLYDRRRIHPDLILPENEFDYFLLENGTVHRLPEAPKTPPPENDYWWDGQEIREHHREWLSKLKAEWWKLIL